MNRFSRVRHHVTVEDVKKKHHEKIAVENFKRVETEIVKDLSQRFRRDWRKELVEGMTTANALSTVLPAEGDTAIDQVSPTDSASFADTTNMFGSGLNNPALDGTTIRANGSGSGSGGGFNVGGEYLAFQGNGSGGSRMALLKPMDATTVDTLTITAIRGNSANGGEEADIVGQEELFLIYKTPDMSRSSYISQDRNNNNVGSFPADAAIIAIGQGDGTLQNYSITIPEYARQKDVVFGLFQLSHSGAGFDHYGITDIKFQRKTPINVVVPLDSPEAISFVRVGTDEGDPKKRKKKVNDQLAASDEYTTKQLGTEFPGQGSRLGDEASSAGAPDPFSSASIQEPDASPIGKSEVTKSFANFSATAAAAEPEAEPETEPITPSSQTTMNPTGDDGEPIPVKPVGRKNSGIVQGADAANVDAQNDQDDAQDPTTTSDPEEPEIPDPEEIKPDPEELEDKTPDEQIELEIDKKQGVLDSELSKLENQFKNATKDMAGFLNILNLVSGPLQTVLNLAGSISSLVSRITGKDKPAWMKIKDDVFGKLNNNISIARSQLTGRIINGNLNMGEYDEFINGVTIGDFVDGTVVGKPNLGPAMINISSERHEYQDDNIYVKDGKIYNNREEKATTLTAAHGGLSHHGEGYAQMIIPPDGGEPYVHYYDYGYNNLNNPDDIGGKGLSLSITSFLSDLSLFLSSVPGVGGTLADAFNKDEWMDGLRNTSSMEGWPPGIHGAVLIDFKVPVSKFSDDIQQMIANHPLSWTPQRIANMTPEDFTNQAFDRFERFTDLEFENGTFDDYAIKAMEDPDSVTDAEFVKNFKRFSPVAYDEETGTHPGAEEGTVQYDYDKAVEELNKIVDTPEYSAASLAASKEYEDVLAERDQKYDEIYEKYDKGKVWEKLVGPHYRAVQRAGNIEYNNPTYQKMVDGYKQYKKITKDYDINLEAERRAIRDEYSKLSDEAFARYEATFQVKELDDGTFGLVNGGDFKTKNGKIIPGMDTVAAKQKARFDEIRAEYDEVQKYLSSANWARNFYQSFVLYDVKTQFSKYGVSGDSWTPAKKGSGKSKSDPTPDPSPSFTGSAGSFVGGDATAAATAAAETNRKKKKKNESLEYFANPHGSVTLYEKLKAKGFFNPKDIKPTFPENDPPEIDKKTGMHPNYGKQAKRYRKLDPMSANAMPVQGDPEIDAVVDKQRTKKKPSERRQDYIKTVRKIKKMAKGV